MITKFLCPEDLILLEGLAHMHTQPDRFQGTPLFCTPETPWASHRQFVSNALQPQYAQAPVLLPEAETWMSSLLPPHKYPTGVEFCRFSHCQLFPACFSLSPSSQHASLCHQGHSIRTGWVMAVALSLASLPPAQLQGRQRCLCLIGCALSYRLSVCVRSQSDSLRPCGL